MGSRGCPPFVMLFFNDFQDVHGTGLDTDAAGNTLAGSAAFFQNHYLHGTCLHALTAGNTELLVDHVNAGLGVLGDGLVLAGTHALAALDADVGLGTGALGHDLDTAQGNIIFLIESLGAGLNALQTSHTFTIFLNSELLHKKDSPLSI